MVRSAGCDWVKRWGVEAARALHGEAAAGYATVRELIAEGNIACDVTEGGYMKIAHRESRIDWLRDELAVLRDTFGANVELLDRDAIAADHYRGNEAFAALRFANATIPKARSVKFTGTGRSGFW
jgi:taurine dehydrogenase large subunit